MNLLLRFNRAVSVHPGEIAGKKEPSQVEMWFLVVRGQNGDALSGQPLETPAGRYVEESAGKGKTRRVYRPHSEEAATIKRLECAVAAAEWDFEIKSMPIPERPLFCHFFAVAREEYELGLEAKER